MIKTTLKIDGMMCGMCESHVNDAVRRRFAVKKVASNHKKRLTEILSEEPLEETALKATLDPTGYTALDIHTERYEKKARSGNKNVGKMEEKDMTNKEYKALSVKEFTKAAEGYEGDKAGVYEMCRKDYPDILAELEKEPWETLLDAGCGPGPMIALLAEKYPKRRYTGIDLTPKMIETAKQKNIPNAEFVVGDCENLPFAPDSFDAVICANSFHHYPNPQAFFDSVCRVLKPGGRLILRDYTAGTALRWLVNHVEMPLVHLAGHGDVGVYSEAQINGLCEKAGLKLEHFERRKGMRMHCVIRKP